MKKISECHFVLNGIRLGYNKANESSGNFFKALNLQADDLV